MKASPPLRAGPLSMAWPLPARRGRSLPSLRPNPTSSLYFSPRIPLLAATTCSSLPIDASSDHGGLRLHFNNRLVDLPHLLLGAIPRSVHAIRPSYCDNICPIGTFPSNCRWFVVVDLKTRLKRSAQTFFLLSFQHLFSYAPRWLVLFFSTLV